MLAGNACGNAGILPHALIPEAQAELQTLLRRSDHVTARRPRRSEPLSQERGLRRSLRRPRASREERPPQAEREACGDRVQPAEIAKHSLGFSESV